MNADRPLPEQISINTNTNAGTSQENQHKNYLSMFLC